MEAVIIARGHPAVRATHASTLEVTTEEYLTPSGDCIVGVGADTAPADLDRRFVRACTGADATITATVTVGDRSATITGRGDPAMTFADETGLVVRTSEYVDDRTVMVDADAAATDLDRDLVRALQDGAPLEVTLSVSVAG